MTDLELAAVRRAVREKAPQGMGDFAVREIAGAAVEAVVAVMRTRIQTAWRRAPNGFMGPDGEAICQWIADEGIRG